MQGGDFVQDDEDEELVPKAKRKLPEISSKSPTSPPKTPEKTPENNVKSDILTAVTPVKDMSPVKDDSRDAPAKNDSDDGDSEDEDDEEEIIVVQAPKEKTQKNGTKLEDKNSQV